MADKLTFEVGLNAAGFRTGIIELERLSAAASVKMNAALASPKIAAGTGMGGAGLVSVSAAIAQAQRAAGRPIETATMSEKELAAWTAAALVTKQQSYHIGTIQDQERELARFKQFEQEQELARIAKVAEMEKNTRLAAIAAVATGGGFSNKLFGESSLFGGGTGPGGGPRGILREMFVIVRELARHNFSRVAGSVTLLAQYMGVLGKVVHSTASESIASAIAQRTLAQEMARAALVSEAKVRTAMREAFATGMSTEAATASTAAQRAQAAALLEAAEAQKVKAAAATEDAEIESQTATISLSAWGYIAIAVLAVAAVAFTTYKIFERLAKAEQNVKDLTDSTTGSFKQQAAALEETDKSAQAETDRLKELAEAEKLVKDAIGETLEIMKERLQLEYKLAEARGASATQLAMMEISGEQQQLDFLNKSNDALRQKIELDKQDEQIALSTLDTFKKSQDAAQMTKAKQNLDKTVEAMDVFQKVIESGNKFVGSGEFALNQMTGQVTEVPRRATAADELLLTVNGQEYKTSLENLTKIRDKEAAIVDELSGKEKSLKDAVSEKQKVTTKDVSDLQKFQGEAQKMQDSLKLHAEFVPKIAAAEQTKQLGSSIGKSAGDSLVKVGNFLGSARGAIDQIEQRKVSLLMKIEQNTRPNQRPMHEQSHYAIH